MSSSDIQDARQIRSYDRANSVVFLKTKEAFGGLSNMAGGFPLHVNGVHIFSSEALYQACRFPHLPDVQRLIIEQRSPMTAKMKSKPHRKNSRADWDQVRVKIMRWCLHVKLAQNWRKFSELLLETYNQPIVEQSRKDDFWGAKPVDDNTLVGMNVLGRLLMELREAIKAGSHESLSCVQPPAISNFLLGGRPIGIVATQIAKMDRLTTQTVAQKSYTRVDSPTVVQSLLFNEQVVEESPPLANPSVKKKGVRITNLKPYPEYRPAGVEWLGEIPSNWRVRRMKYVVHEIDSRSTSGKEQLLRISQYTGVTKRHRTDGLEEPDTRAASLVGYKRVEPNDLVINIMLAWNGSMGVSRYEGITSPAYCVYRFGHDLHPWYFHNLLRSPAYKVRIRALSTGVVESRLRLYTDDLGRIEALVPPYDEQTTIVRFLDWADRRLKRTIRAKRELVVLLEELKQAIIHQTVTGQIDVRTGQPYPAYKDSEVERLGVVPAHWDLQRLKHWVLMNQNTLSDTTDPDYTFNYVDIGSVEPGRITTQLEQMRFRDSPSRARRVVQSGDTIVSTVRTYLKAVWHAKEGISDLIASTGFAVLTPKPGTWPKFVNYLCRSESFTDQVTADSVGVVYPAIAETKLGAFKVVVPPFSEQTEIVRYLDQTSSKIDEAIARTKREIELLCEYSKRLISDVVTGKLDVREAATKLPQETNEPIAIENIDDQIGDENLIYDSERAVRGRLS